MKIIIAGAGEVGYHLAKLLSFESHDITLIDNQKSNLNIAENKLDIKTIEGNSASISVLKDANVENSDLVVSLTTSETTNFTTCILSKQLGAKRTIARISNVEFIKDCNEIDFNSIGIDELISPENLAAEEIKLILSDSAFTNTHDFDDGALKMMAVRLEKNAPFVGKTVMEAASVFPGVHFMPIALKREDSETTIIPRGNTIFCECDHVYFITNSQGLKELYNLMGTEKQKINNVTNIMSCLMAKSKKIKKTIALVENMDYFNLSQSIGIDTLINKKLLAANDIFKFVRNGDIVELAKLNDMDAEIVEFIVNENSKVLDKKIMDLDFPLTAIIGGVIRNNQGIIALGDFEIQLGDRVLVCSKPESIKKVESLFL